MPSTNPTLPAKVPSSEKASVSDLSDATSNLSLNHDSGCLARDASPVHFSTSAANYISTRSLHIAALNNSRLQQDNQSAPSRPESPTPSTLSDSSHIAILGSPVLGAITPTPANIKNDQPTSAPTTTTAAADPPQPIVIPTGPLPTTRRKSILLNVQNYEPNMPAPGEVANSPVTSRRPSFGPGIGSANAGSPVQRRFPPGHNHQASLGEIHQELEVEQEAQVNRLLHMIREQQIELNNRQAAYGHPLDDESAVATSPTLAAIAPACSSTSRPPSFNYGPLPLAAHPNLHPHTSFEVSHRRRSRTPSVDVDIAGYNYGHTLGGRVLGASPRVRTSSMSGESDVGSLSKDESAFYQAEAQIITRENQMLRHRIKALEKQVAEMNTNPAVSPHDPAKHSSLAQSRLADEEI